MRRRPAATFTVYTDRGRGSYRTRAMAESAARWAADETGHGTTVVNEGTGETWEVAIPPPSDR